MKLGKVLLYIIIVPLTVLTLCCIAPGICAECTTMIAVSAVSLLLNITLATVILIHCLFVLRRKRPKDMLHSTNDETYAEPIKQVDVSTAPNEAYGLHKITKSSEEDITYEMVK